MGYILVFYFWLRFFYCLFTGPHAWIKLLFILPKFYIIFILSPTPFLLPFCGFFFHLITEFELEFYNIFSLWSQAGNQHLKSGYHYFKLCFQYLNPRFTTLCNQMYRLAMGLNLCTIYLRQPQQRLIFSTPHQCLYYLSIFPSLEPSKSPLK